MKQKYSVSYVVRYQPTSMPVPLSIYFPAVQKSPYTVVLTSADLMYIRNMREGVRDIVASEVRRMATDYYKHNKRVPDSNVHPDWDIPGGQYRSFLEVEVDFGDTPESKGYDVPKSEDSPTPDTEVITSLEKLLGSIIVDHRMPANRVVLVSFATRAGDNNKVLLDGVQIVGLYNK